MSTSVHKPASANPFASYVFQENEEDELEEDGEEEEVEWSDEEDLYSDDDEFEVEFEDDFCEDNEHDDYDEFDDDNDSDTEGDHHEYLDDGDRRQYKNNYSAGQGYFYPEQPYIGPPIVPKPSHEASTSKLNYYVLSPICDIATIYIKFAILAILIYACALWYTIYYGDLSSITNDMDDDDADTCPAI